MKLGSCALAFKLLLTVALTVFSVRAHAENFTIANKAWPESFYQAAMATSAPSGQSQFTNALFDAGDTSTLFGDDFNPNNTFPIQIDRNVYPNFDLLGTVTAIDQIKLYDETPLIGVAGALAKANELIPFPFANVNFIVRGAIEFRDIRQLTPDQAKIVSFAAKAPEFAANEVNPYLNSSKLSTFDSTRIPFKIPLSRGNIRNMQVGEIVSYTLSGQVGFGGSVGLKLLPSDVMSAGASLLLETFLVGSFQVSIMKESERFAKVCISRLHGHEQDAQLQAGIAFSNFVNGFFVFKNKDLNTLIESVTENVVPFQYQVLSEKDKEMSVAYRYDLDSDEGRDSFHHAVLGSFKESDEASGVNKLFNRVSYIKTKQKTQTLDLSFFLNLQHGQKKRDDDHRD
jgi:hypothetical protein